MTTLKSYLLQVLNEVLSTNPEVVRDYVLPTLRNKTTFWVPLKRKHLASLLPPVVKLKPGDQQGDQPGVKSTVVKFKAFHQLGVKSLTKLLNVKRNVAVSTFTNVDDYKSLFKKSIGGAGFGLLALVEGLPLVNSSKDLKTRRELNRRWVNFANVLSYSSYEGVKNTVLKKVQEYLGGKDPTSFNTKETNNFVSFYYKTVWSALKEELPKKQEQETTYYKHFSFDSPIKTVLLSQPQLFASNRSNNLSYNELVLDNVKVLKVYYDASNQWLLKDLEKFRSTLTVLLVPFSVEEFLKDLQKVSNQKLQYVTTKK